MSVNAIEKALWQACADPADAQCLREDAPRYLQRFGIDEPERSLVASWDVAGMLRHGVHPMLVLMSHGAVNGAEAMGAYLQKLYGQSPAGPSH